MGNANFAQKASRIDLLARRYFGILLALLRLEESGRRAEPLATVMSLAEPLLLIAVATLALQFVHRGPAPLGDNPVLFYATGFYTNYFFIHISRRMGRSIDSPHRRYPIERRLDHIITHVLVSSVDYAILGLLVFGAIYVFFTARALPSDMVPVLEACIAIVMLGFGWGVINLVLSRASTLWRSFFPALNRFLVIFSGLFFIVDFVPPIARNVLSYNPMAHVIILFRLGFYPNEPRRTLDVEYLAYCAIFALLLGLALERCTRRTEG